MEKKFTWHDEKMASSATWLNKKKKIREEKAHEKNEKNIVWAKKDIELYSRVRQMKMLSHICRRERDRDEEGDGGDDDMPSVAPSTLTLTHS